MGVLKNITDEYFGDTKREEDFPDITELDVEIVSFTDNNGKFHKSGYRVVRNRKTIGKMPETLSRLIEIVIEKHGVMCDLNFIDVSNMHSMCKTVGRRKKAYESIFHNVYEFNGDISGWDVSNVVNMEGMFANSKFTGKNGIFKLPKGNNITNMKDIFINSMFDGDISDWDVSNVTNMYRMFKGSSFSYDISGWNVNENCFLKDMFKDSPLDGNEPEWYKKWYEKIKGTIWEC